MSNMFKGQFIRVQFDTLSHSVDLDCPEQWSSHNWRDSYRSHDNDEEKNDEESEEEARQTTKTLNQGCMTDSAVCVCLSDRPELKPAQRY